MAKFCAESKNIFWFFSKMTPYGGSVQFFFKNSRQIFQTYDIFVFSSIFLVVLKFEIFVITIQHMFWTFIINFRIVEALLIYWIAFIRPLWDPKTGMTFKEGKPQYSKKQSSRTFCNWINYSILSRMFTGTLITKIKTKK